VRSEQSFDAELDVRENILRGQLRVAREEHRKSRLECRARGNERRALEARLDEVKALRRNTFLPTAQIHAPQTECFSQLDWVIGTLRANPAGLTQLQLLEYLETRIRTKSNPRKAILTALSHLTTDKRITLFNGVYRAVEHPVR